MTDLIESGDREGWCVFGEKMAMNAMEHRKIPHIGEVYRREDNVREGEAAGREEFFQLVIDVPSERRLGRRGCRDGCGPSQESVLLRVCRRMSSQAACPVLLACSAYDPRRRRDGCD